MNLRIRGQRALACAFVAILVSFAAIWVSAQPGPSSGGGPGQTTPNPLKLRELSANPASSTDVGIIFTREVGGITELHFRDSSGNIRQLTPPGGGGVGTLADIYENGVLKVNDATELDFLTSPTVSAAIATTTATHATISRRVVGAFASTTTLLFDQVITDGNYISRSGTSFIGTATASPTAHATNHQNGGSDEVSVAGLSGLLADAQTPTTHAASHQNGGSDEVSVTDLSGELADRQKVAVNDNSGGINSTRAILNFIGSGTSITISDNVASGQADITISAAASASDIYTATYVVAATSSGASASAYTHTTINAAVASSVGFTSIYLLPGVHTLTGTVTIPTATATIHFVGFGRATVVTIPNATNADVFTTSGTGTFRMSNFAIDGNKAGQGAGTHDGLSVVTNVDAYLDNMRILQCKDNGVLVSANGGSLRFEAADTESRENDGDGWEFAGDSHVNGPRLSGCSGMNNGGNGILHSGGGAGILTLTGGTWDGNTANGVFVSNGFTGVVTGIRARANTLSGVRHDGDGSVSASECDGNSAYGISGQSPSVISRVAITGNSVEGNVLSGIGITANWRGTIVGNTIRSNTQHGVLLTGTSIATVSDNAIQDNGATFDGIRLDGSSDVAVTGNRIRDGAYGISEINAVADNKLSNNHATGFSTAASLMIASGTRIHDPRVVSLTITRAAASGTAAEVIDASNYAAAAGFKPTSVEFLGSDNGAAAVYSDGWTDSLVNTCHAHSTASDTADSANAINIVNSVGDGYTATVDLLGKANGSTQEGFRIQWVVAGAGRAITVKALLRR